jgi:D-sedoheptulose 7-phosphate isomerase
MKKDSSREAGLRSAIEASADTVRSLLGQIDGIESACGIVVGALKNGNKVLAAGNGGSAAEAMHMSEELVGRFRFDRRPLPAISLAADPTAITCIGNDFGYDAVFARQVEGLGRPGDVLVLFSTSGKSRNLVLALQQARRGGLKTVSFLGKGGGPMAGLSDAEVIVASQQTERIQEAHQVLMHIVLDAVERAFPPEAAG